MNKLKNVSIIIAILAFNLYIIKSQTTETNKWPVKMIKLENGAVVKAWTTFNEDGEFYDVKASIINYNNESSNSFRVNMTTEGSQFDPVIKIIPGNRFIIVWTSYNPSNENYDIMAMLYNADGHALSGELLVNENTRGNQYHPVISLDDENILISWKTFHDQTEIMNGRYLSFQGDLLKKDFEMSHVTENHTKQP